MEVQHTVCAVVVTYNRLALLKECIGALQAQSRAPDRILVVDNGSTDETGRWLDQQDGLWVIHQANVGGAGGFCRGIKEAFDAGFDLIWIMDDDVLPEAPSLRVLIEAAASVPEYGFLASRVKAVDGLPLNVPDIETGSLENGSSAWPQDLDKGLIRLRSATFVSVLFSRTIVSEVGFPIAEMFIWGDDIEYTTRISRRYPSYFVIDSKVVHKRGNQKRLSIVNEDDPCRIKMFYYHYRNSVFVSKRFSNIKQLLYILYFSFREAVAVLPQKRALLKLKIIVSGLMQGWLFNPSR